MGPSECARIQRTQAQSVSAAIQALDDVRASDAPTHLSLLTSSAVDHREHIRKGYGLGRNA